MSVITAGVTSGEQRRAGRIDAMSAAQFQEELRRAGRLILSAPLDDPLEAALKQIEQNPTTMQCRLLARLLTALTYDRGEFRRAESSALDSPTLALALDLMNAHASGKLPQPRWVSAVEAADAAQLRAG